MKIAYLWVAIGGALGTVGRFWLSGLVAARYGKMFPWGPKVGICGGDTTFSSFSLQTLN